VAANLARDEARAAVRRKRHLTLLKEDPATMPSSPAPADEMVEEDERRAHDGEGLPTRTKRAAAVLLLWAAGLSYAEIAQQTGLAVGGVGTTLARARKRLVDAYDRSEQENRLAHS